MTIILINKKQKKVKMIKNNFIIHILIFFNLENPNRIYGL
jgi:hypothetical protein